MVKPFNQLMLSHLTKLVKGRQIGVTDLAIHTDEATDGIEVVGRCTCDPLLFSPRDNAGDDGPWNHTRVTFSLQFLRRDGRSFWKCIATMATVVDASHAQCVPASENAPEVRICCRWEFQSPDIHSVCELRDGDRVHFLNVLPPDWLERLAKACSHAAHSAGRIIW